MKGRILSAELGRGASLDSASRLPTAAELQLLQRLAAAVASGSELLVEQVLGVRVATLDANGSLRLIAPTGPELTGVRRIPVEGEYSDEDGMTVHVLLHLVRGRLHELEVFREDSGKVNRRADSVGSLRILVT